MHGTFEREARLRPRNAEPLPELPETPFAAPISCNGRSQSETGDDCEGFIALLNSKLRVIIGSCGLQWLLQNRSPSQWRNVAYCATKEGLLLRVKAHLQAHSGEKTTLPLDVLVSRYCDPAAWATIQALPEFFPKPAKE